MVNMDNPVASRAIRFRKAEAADVTAWSEMLDTRLPRLSAPLISVDPYLSRSALCKGLRLYNFFR